MGKIADRFKAKVLKVQPSCKGRTLAEVLADKTIMIDSMSQYTNRPTASGHDLALTDPKEFQKTWGQYDGYCNVTACKSGHDVRYWNKYTNRFYCGFCAFDINHSNARFKDCDDGAPFVNEMTPEAAAEQVVYPRKL